MRRGLIGFVAAIIFTAACSTHIDWRNHISFRSYGKGIRLSHVKAKEATQGAIKANLHYMSIGIDAVFFRDLAGMYGKNVVLAFEIEGLLPKGQVIKTVLDIARAEGTNGFLSFDNLPVIKPFLYTGKNVNLTLHFMGVTDQHKSNIEGRIQAAGDLTKGGIDPTNYHSLYAGLNLFTQVVAGSSSSRSWKYSTTLYPSESIYRDKPEMLLTAARHIFLCIAPPNAPPEFRLLQPRHLIRMLKMRGNRLIWKRNGNEYTHTPYVVLNIRRYKRYPNPEIEVRKIEKMIDNLIANKNYRLALAMLSRLGEAINDDTVITENEKNLARAWRDFREARIKRERLKPIAEQAREQKLEVIWKDSLKKALRQVNNQVVYLGLIRSQFSKILYAYEASKINFLAKRLSLDGEKLARDIGGPIDKVRQVFVEYVKRARKGKIEVVYRDKDYDEENLKKIPLPDEAMLKKRSKPFWKKWWFWTLIGLGAAGAGVGGYFALRPTPAAPNEGMVAPVGAP